jgi:LacI family transcriptional regulator
VSRVINGRAEVSEKAREAVLRVVREHGYSTNRTARGLSAGRTGLVGVTTPWSTTRTLR